MDEAYSRSTIVTFAIRRLRTSSAAHTGPALLSACTSVVISLVPEAPERMAQRDRPAVHVQPFRIGAQRLQPGQRHGAKRFVHFVQVDVRDLHPRLGQRALRRGDRCFQHDHRVVAQHAHVMDARQRLHAQAFRPRSFTTSTPLAPSQIWLALAALMRPPRPAA
jgi:hypothetical protein